MKDQRHVWAKVLPVLPLRMVKLNRHQVTGPGFCAQDVP
jgi:hypothetical protein